MPTIHNSHKAGWGINEWFLAVGFSRSQTYLLMDDGLIPNVKVGRRRLITISPADFLASYAERSAQIEPGSALPLGDEPVPETYYRSEIEGDKGAATEAGEAVYYGSSGDEADFSEGDESVDVT
jgi:hypothetical protein